jgi:hypothetical protein
MTNRNAVEHVVRRWLEDVLAEQSRAIGLLRMGMQQQVNIARTTTEEDVLLKMYEAWKATRAAQRLVAMLHPNASVSAAGDTNPQRGKVSLEDITEMLERVRLGGSE